MYSYTYDKKTGGILLNSSPTGFSKEPRPVYAAELDVLGLINIGNMIGRMNYHLCGLRQIVTGIEESSLRNLKVAISTMHQR